MALTDKLTAIADAIRAKTGKTAALTLDQMPTEIAGINVAGGGGSSGDGSSRVIENVVNIGVTVSVTAENYYTHFLYNGVRLPRIPDDVLKNYPYAWIRDNKSNGYYQLVFSPVKTWYDTNIWPSDVAHPYYQIEIAKVETATEWEYVETSYASFGLDGVSRTVLWSNHDIPNGSADATDIYFAGSEPVPTD